MRVIVTAGGTGGHIYPALSIIKKIQQEEPNSEILYIGTTDRMEARIVPNAGFNYYGINVIGLHKNLTIFKSLFLFIKAIFNCKKKIKEFNPDLVIGVGGYVTAPVLYAAHSLKIKTIIHEQNSIPGKSNRFLINKANKILVSLPGSLEHFPKDKTVYTGNPRSQEAYECQVYSKTNLGFHKDKKLVLIVMGSLGSETINKELLNFIPEVKNKDYEFLIITGKDHFEEFNIDIPNNVKILPYLDNMINLMKDIDIIVTRSGASTIAEITSLGIPSIMVPSPYVANNHQYFNAMELVNKKAALLLEEKDFKSVNLIKNIDLLLKDKVLYNSMKENALSLGKHDSANLIYKEIKKLF